MSSCLISFLRSARKVHSVTPLQGTPGAGRPQQPQLLPPSVQEAPLHQHISQPHQEPGPHRRLLSHQPPDHRTHAIATVRWDFKPMFPDAALLKNLLFFFLNSILFCSFFGFRPLCVFVRGGYAVSHGESKEGSMRHFVPHSITPLIRGPGLHHAFRTILAFNLPPHTLIG